MGDIDVAFVKQVSSNFTHKVQQEKSKFLDKVTIQKVVGKHVEFELIGATEAVDVTNRHDKSPIMDVPHFRRRAVLETKRWGELIDDPDKVRMLIDPRSAYIQAGAMAVARKADKLIIAAMLGNARSIDNADASTNVTFDANMIVGVDFGATASNFNFEKLKEARNLLLTNEVDPDDEMFCGFNADALTALLGESEVQSRDTNALQPLVEGKVGRFMGVSFFLTEKIPNDSNGDHQAIMFTRSAIGVGVGREPILKIGTDPSYNFYTRIIYEMDLGAVRLEEERIVLIKCSQ